MEGQGRRGGSDIQLVVTTGSASSSASSRLRTPADISECAHSAAVSGSGYSDRDVDDVTSLRAGTPDSPSLSSTPQSVDMATTDLTRPQLEHELTYSDMEAPKGLRNSHGENNCFLNSAVQVRAVDNSSLPNFVASFVCLCVCVFVNTITSEPVNIG